VLKTNGIAISMSRKGNPWDNAACESFMKTLKYEEVLRNEYRDLPDARASIREFLEKVYNQKRLHSAPGLHAASQVRSHAKGCRCAAAFFMSFSQASGNLSIRWRRRPCGQRPRSSSEDCQFQLAIPWRVALQQRPASALPTGQQYAVMSSCRSERFSSNGQLCLNCLCQSRGQAHRDHSQSRRISPMKMTDS